MLVSLGKNMAFTSLGNSNKSERDGSIGGELHILQTGVYKTISEPHNSFM
jgi:hypothetical protein